MPNPYKRLTYSRRVLVNLKSGRAFRGYMIEVAGELLLLKGASLLEPGSEPVDVAGEVLIEKSNVDFIQVIE